MNWRPTATLEALRVRARQLAQVRQFFDARGYLEVETPVLSADVVVDRHLDPLSTILPDDPRRVDMGRRLWMQTSPEFCMKRLLAAGSGPIYQVARAFRGGECGPRHNPEFTLVEWYQPGATYEAGMQELGELAERLLARGAAERVSYQEAFFAKVGVDAHRATISDLAAAAERHGVSVPESLHAGGAEERDGWLDLLLVELVEPHLGHAQPTVLYDYPASQAALARVRTDRDGTQVAERFERYVAGVELANGYHELTDADELAARNHQNNALRRRDGKPELPVDSRLLAAMRAGLPASVGVALGLDRVVMLAMGARTVAEVQAFGIERA